MTAPHTDLTRHLSHALSTESHAVNVHKHLTTNHGKAKICSGLTTIAASILLMQSNTSYAAPAQDSSAKTHAINNIASSVYNVENGAEILATQSNQVSVHTTILPKYGVSLTQPALKIIAAGSEVQWINTLTNTGNIDETIRLSFGVPNTLSNFVVYQDINKNGLIDASDPQVFDKIQIGQNESIDLIVKALTDKNLKNNDTASIKVGAVVIEDESITAHATDKLRVIAPSIEFTDKSFNKIETQDQIGNDVYVQTSYAQCNINSNAPDQALVTITSSKTKDTYTLKATETGNNTGIFRLSAPTELNANAINDNIIQTLDGDMLKASLDACISPSGNPVKITQNIFTQIQMMDPKSNLQVVKTADVKAAELGDYVNYSINITNTGKNNATVYDINLKDALPRGFTYVEGSARVDGKPVADFSSKGKYKVLGLGTLTQGQNKTVTYQALVGATALAGDGINTAFVTGNDTSGKTITSRPSKWKVDVSRNAINEKGIIVGKVYNDINRDGIQQKQDGELGVAGVRLYMENGNFVVTDAEGKYDFYGIDAKTHVLKIDRTTLPANVELIEQSNRNTGDPSSVFVDVKYGELHRADFAIVDGMDDTSEHLKDILIERSKSTGDNNDALEKTVRNQLDIEPRAITIDNRTFKEASGCKQNNSLDQRLSCDNAIVDTEQDLQSIEVMPLNLVTAPKPVLLEEYLKKVSNNNVNFINLSDQQQLIDKIQLIQIQAPLDTKFTLYANGQPVSAEKIGKTAEQKKQSVAAYDYYAVKLEAGKNILKGVATNTDGEVISEQSITVFAPDTLQNIEAHQQDKLVSADGNSIYQVVIRLKDKNGRPYPSDTLVTLDTNIGQVNLKDTSTDVPGTQVIVTGGELLVPIKAPTTAGDGVLTVTANNIKQTIPLQFTPHLRPLIAVGIIDGSISLKGFDSSKVSSAEGLFEQELEEFSGNNDYSTNGRAAMFLKGKVRGDYLLTLSYDSDKGNERLFRDIEPSEYYPVYGDASAKGFDAQSSSKLYVRLDKGRSYAMYGDIKTQVDNDEGLKLGQYNRTLTGFKAQYEDDNTRIVGFAAETNTTQRVMETQGLGISGPYPLAVNFNNVLENSEIVEVITRDADNPGVVISKKQLTRFADYEIDPISRSIYLKNPIASQDFDGNPIYLQVTVETDDGGEKYWVGGIAGKQQINDAVSVGASYVKSDNPLNEETLASVNSVIQINKNLKFVAEYAKNKSENSGLQKNTTQTHAIKNQKVEGDAMRLELTYDDKKRTRAKAYYNKADTGFVSQSSPITAGRTESGIDIDYKLDSKRKTTAKLEGIRSEDNNTDTIQQGVKASIERQLTDNITAEIGARYYKQNNTAQTLQTQSAPEVVSLTNNTVFNDNIINQSALNNTNSNAKDVEGTTLLAKVTVDLPKLNRSKIFAEYEQDINNSSRNATSIGAETALGNMGRFYARHDLINSLSGNYGLDDTSERNRTVIGFDANYMKDGKVYSEYRTRNSISAREAEAAIGLKNKWYIQEGLTVNTLIERIESLEGKKDKTSTAASVGVEYLANKNYKASGRLEKRWGEKSDTLLASAGVAYRYDDNITLLAKDIYSNVDYTNGHRMMNRFQLGAAYRDYDSNQLDMLAKVEYRTDDNQTGTAPYQKDATIWSWHGNYHPTRPLTISGHYAGKHTQYKTNNSDNSNTAHTAYIRGLYDINEKWDAGLQAGTYWNDQADDVAYMLGAEVGYSPMTNLWLSLGYNFAGYNDDDIAYEDTTAQGAYFRMRFKFDENLFKRNDAKVNKRLLPE
ncbi:SdrD B-like domain-containing protein [Psychrobacter sp. I-STPA10]|uniref:SdrD B-like domain-containing protein n=1 Tax=Psychrobacter sp. I-STPA10 TaxID=2585769 RepID=UPI001E39806A|nr:DUF11 domain-containing protein [Psychrobacter sp. I-STPA10]